MLSVGENGQKKAYSCNKPIHGETADKQDDDDVNGDGAN